MVIDTPKVWSIVSDFSAVEAVAQRESREQAFLMDPETMQKMAYEWLPGTLAKHGDVTWMSCRAPLFQSDYVRMITNLDALEKDDSCSVLCLDVNSPGGDVAGCPEAADAFKRFSKRTVTVASGIMASAAYWISSQTDLIIASPTCTVGSIGVRITHTSIAGMLKSAGIEITEFGKGSKKNEFSGNKKLAESAKEEYCAHVEHFYGLFVDAVKNGRENIKEETFDSGIYFGQDAVSVGLVDELENKPIGLL